MVIVIFATIEALESELIEMNIATKSLQTEESVDLFDTIFKKVGETRSEKKRTGLKNILVHGLKHQDQIEYCELFAEHLLSFHLKELEILAFHQYYLLQGKGPLIRRNELKEELNQQSQARAKHIDPIVNIFLPTIDLSKARAPHILAHEFKESERLLKEYQQECVAERFGISEDELRFFMQNLLSRFV